MPDAARLVVSNTTPIITLSLIGQLSLLQRLYGTVLIPSAVKTELLAGGSRYGAVELQRVNYIQTTPLQTPRYADLLSDLDRGEAEAIALALEQNATRRKAVSFCLLPLFSEEKEAVKQENSYEHNRQASGSNERYISRLT